MLTDSAWARSTTLAFELHDERRFKPTSFLQIGMPRMPGIPGLGSGRQSPGTGSSVRTEIYLTTRWASALPIRQALALSEFGVAGLDNDRAVELLKPNEQEYVIEIAGFPTTLIRQGAERFAEELQKTARLTVPSRPAIVPASVNVPPHGMHLMATLRFPRLADLATKDGTIELSLESGAFKIRERFKLEKMVYEGQLEL
jgi:hypothetical protein